MRTQPSRLLAFLFLMLLLVTSGVPSRAQKYGGSSAAIRMQQQQAMIRQQQRQRQMEQQRQAMLRQQRELARQRMRQQQLRRQREEMRRRQMREMQRKRMREEQRRRMQGLQQAAILSSQRAQIASSSMRANAVDQNDRIAYSNGIAKLNRSLTTRELRQGYTDKVAANGRSLVRVGTQVRTLPTKRVGVRGTVGAKAANQNKGVRFDTKKRTEIASNLKRVAALRSSAKAKARIAQARAAASASGGGKLPPSGPRLPKAANDNQPRTGPIPRSLGAMSRAEALAKRLRLNANSPTTRQLLHSLDNTVSDFVGKYRRGSIKSRLPGEVMNMTVEKALQHSSTVRKLLTDNRFAK